MISHISQIWFSELISNAINQILHKKYVFFADFVGEWGWSNGEGSAEEELRRGGSRNVSWQRIAVKRGGPIIFSVIFL